MKILTRYSLREMLGPTTLGFAFYTSLIVMREVFELAGMIIRRSLPASVVGKILLLSLPHIVVLTVPMSLLFGVLIAVGRMSADSEIIALRALGISMRRIYVPVFVFSFAMFLLNLYLINVVMPTSNAQLQTLWAELLTSSVEKDVKPRIFYDDYENLVIYVNDVDPRTGRWKGVFVSDTRSNPADDKATTPQQVIDRANQKQETASALTSGGGQRIVVAQTGTLATIKETKQVWMNLTGAETHVWDPRKPDRYDRNRNDVQRLLVADRSTTELTSTGVSRSLREMDLRQLLRQAQATKNGGDRLTYNLARVEIHKKFAIPFACLVFGILGLPLGITNRRGGKSSGFSLSIAIILVYYVLMNNGEHLAAAGQLPPAVAMWTPNIVLLAVGIYLLTRANRDAGSRQSDAGFVRRAAGAIHQTLTLRRQKTKRTGTATEESSSVLNRLDITFPNILDRYVLREFLKILFLVLISTMALFVIVDYTEIAKDVRENNIAFHTVVTYYRFYVFQVINMTLPISVLVATLVTFGMLSKNNEVTALKSTGVSLYRVAMPIVAIAGVISVVSYFNLDYVLPYANQRVATIKRKIEGKRPISAGAQKLWFIGKGRYLINFLAYSREEQSLSQVQIFEFDPTEFKLTRRVYANRAKWNGRAWVFQDGGWIRSFLEDGTTTYAQITTPLALYYPETPEDFETEVRAPDQMTFAQLHRYIETIRSTGYGADDLAVKMYTKTSWPAISLVMALIALPFAFKMGKKGALYGIAIAFALGIVYWMVFAIFTKFGEVGNLPALLSAWSANILFAIGAVYMFLHAET